jgi:hypothetical protein
VDQQHVTQQQVECSVQIPAVYPSAVVTTNAPTLAAIYPTLLNATASGKIARSTTVLSVMPTQNFVREETVVTTR